MRLSCRCQGACATLSTGDCTTAQLTELYGGRTLRFPAPSSTRRLCRLGRSRMLFSVHVECNRDALRAELGVSEDRLVLFPSMSIPTNGSRWNKSGEHRQQVLFIGRRPQRKGGDIIYDLARLESFETSISRRLAAREPGPEIFTRSIIPAGIRRSHSAGGGCDVFILPTRADASPLSNGGGRLRSPRHHHGAWRHFRDLVEDRRDRSCPSRGSTSSPGTVELSREPNSWRSARRNARGTSRNYPRRVTLRSCMT